MYSSRRAIWTCVSSSLRGSRLLTPASQFFARVAELVDLVLGQSAASVPLFGPRIAVHVIAVLLPESRQVVVQQLEASYPLRALPEVEMRHEQPGGPAVLRREPFPGPRECDEVLRPVQVRERQVRREALLGDDKTKLRRRFETGPLEQRLHGHALECVIQSAPGGHAMDIADYRLSRQREQLVVGERKWPLDESGNHEGPLGGIDRRDVTVMQDRPFGGLDLAGRETIVDGHAARFVIWRGPQRA